MTYSGVASDEEMTAISLVQAIETARVACEALLGERCGEASLYLSIYRERLRNDGIHGQVHYMQNGIPVSFPMEAARRRSHSPARRSLRRR